MKNTVEIIKVVYACNDVYIIQTIVSITSLLCNNVNNKIKIYVIGDNISDENRKKLENAIMCGKQILKRIAMRLYE